MGRTETYRSVSDESVAFCEAMANPDANAEQCVDLLRKALDVHCKYVSDAYADKIIYSYIPIVKSIPKSASIG
jgi:hypothetical protein